MKAVVMTGMVLAGLLALGTAADACSGCAAHAAPKAEAAEKPVEQEAEKAELKTQETCPIMNSRINKDLYVDHDGQRIYVCCNGCRAAVARDPEAALAKLAELGERAEKIKTAEDE